MFKPQSRRVRRKHVGCAFSLIQWTNASLWCDAIDSLRKRDAAKAGAVHRYFSLVMLRVSTTVPKLPVAAHPHRTLSDALSCCFLVLDRRGHEQARRQKGKASREDAPAAPLRRRPLSARYGMPAAHRGVLSLPTEGAPKCLHNVAYVERILASIWIDWLCLQGSNFSKPTTRTLEIDRSVVLKLVGSFVHICL